MREPSAQRSRQGFWPSVPKTALASGPPQIPAAWGHRHHRTSANLRAEVNPDATSASMSTARDDAQPDQLRTLLARLDRGRLRSRLRQHRFCPSGAVALGLPRPGTHRPGLHPRPGGARILPNSIGLRLGAGLHAAARRAPGRAALPAQLRKPAPPTSSPHCAAAASASGSTSTGGSTPTRAACAAPSPTSSTRRSRAS